MSTTPCLNTAAIARSGFLCWADDRTTRAFLAVPKESSTTWVPTATLVCCLTTSMKSFKKPGCLMSCMAIKSCLLLALLNKWRASMSCAALFLPGSALNSLYARASAKKRCDNSCWPWPFRMADMLQGQPLVNHKHRRARSESNAHNNWPYVSAKSFSDRSSPSEQAAASVASTMKPPLCKATTEERPDKMVRK